MNNSFETNELITKLLASFQTGTPTKSSNWDLTSSGSIKANFKNALTAINQLGLLVRRNVFSGVIEITNVSGWSTLARDQEGPLSDTTLAFLRKHIQEVFEFDPKADLLAAAIGSQAEDGRYNPLVDWLASLSWDGSPRLEAWLPQMTGCEDNEINRAIGELLVLAMVARARYPGTKFDCCVVFEGPQGCGKSTLVRALASGPGDTYFADPPGLIGMDNKERAELIGGKWVVELAELSGLAKSESEGVKAFLAQTSDRFRPAYGRSTIERPRSCVFIGTTNARTYLSDNSGNRRFLPVECVKVDLTTFRENHLQIIAEADRKLDGLCKAARAAGMEINAGRSLPFDFANQHLTLAAGLRDVAAERAELRRHTDAIEEAVQAVMSGALVGRQKLPDGRTFVASKDVMAALRDHLKTNVNGSGLGGWMARLGWEHTVTGPKETRVRGYAKREVSV